MAKLIKAVAALGPRLELGKMAVISELISFIAGRTGLNKGDILQVVNELNEGIVFYTLSGRGIKIDGLGVFKPSVNLKGELSMTVRLDTSFAAELNKPKAFKGDIAHREMMGKTTQDIITKWNEKHPDDPVVTP